MALARCDTCGSPQGLQRNYLHFHALIPSGNFTILCGSPTCTHPPGCIWLTEEEEREYLNGRRSFRLSKRSLHVQVQ